MLNTYWKIKATCGEAHLLIMNTSLILNGKEEYYCHILKAAKQVDSYKRKCQLEDDKVVINERRYSNENLHQLPSDINVFEITSKTSEDCVGFFGALNPLSNFYESKLIVDGIEYLSFKQFIQAQKAKYFSDNVCYTRIMGANNSLDCQNAARGIRNFDQVKWEALAGSLCKEGIRAKFVQNPHI